MMKIYLDNAATTGVYPEVAKLMENVMVFDYGNPSSRHMMGVIAEEYIKEAKNSFAGQMKVKQKEIIFTSGGTESDNLAIIGAARAAARRGKHLITTCIEHPAVYNAFAYLEEEGFLVTYLSVDEKGQIDLLELADALREDTILVSIMHVNNEIGTMLQVAKAGEIIKNYNSSIVFHIDGIQAYGKIPVYPARLHADLYSISGHKFHGPKGIGVLYKREGLRILPILYGGGQQQDLRSGTENVPGIAGIGLASCLMYQNHSEKLAFAQENKKRLISGIQKIENTVIHGSTDEEGTPYIVSAGFKGIKGEVLLHALEEQGIYVSSGSACASNHPAISGVLKAIGAKDEFLDSTIRFSFSEFNTTEEINATLDCLYNIVPMLRKYTRH